MEHAIKEFRTVLAALDITQAASVHIDLQLASEAVLTRDHEEAAQALARVLDTLGYRFMPFETPPGREND